MAQKQKITKVSISEWMDQERVAGLLNYNKRTNTFHLWQHGQGWRTLC